MSEPMSIDALLPPEMARRAEVVGACKCRLPFWPLLTLAILAGAFIALGAVFSTIVSAGTAGVGPRSSLPTNSLYPTRPHPR